MLARDVTVVSPRWNGETYELAKLKGLSERHLRRGPMNILEPAEAELVEPSDIAVWIVPGLVFTQDGKRIGYGGGWYDRLLAGAKSSVKIGVAHEFQIVDDLPHEPHDIQLTCVVTDC
jgi:5-formyltetrahydrofolate cyclo-ligase